MMAEAVRSDKSERSDVQVFVAKTDRQGFEIIDMLDARPGWSKLKLHLWSYGPSAPMMGNAAKHELATRERVEFYLDTSDFKTIARTVIARFSPFGYSSTPGAPDRLLWDDHKGTEREGGYQARIIEIAHRPSRDYPFEVSIKNGVGRPTNTGAVTMQKVEHRLTFRFTQFDFVSMCGEVLDWIRDWEVRHYGDRREARTVKR